jgi:hypothetical protein
VENPARVAAGRHFDGLSGLVAVASDPDLDPGAGDFSLDAWIRPTGDGDRPIITKQHAPADSPLGFALGLNEGFLELTMANDASGIVATAPVGLAPDGQWRFVAVTVRRGSTTGGRLYVDGALVHTFDTTPLLGAVDTTAPLHIGQQPALGRGRPARHFLGGIDEVELFHRALTATEVGALFAAGSFGKCDKPPLPTATAAAMPAQLVLHPRIRPWWPWWRDAYQPR